MGSGVGVLVGVGVGVGVLVPVAVAVNVAVDDKQVTLGEDPQGIQVSKAPQSPLVALIQHVSPGY